MEKLNNAVVSEQALDELVKELETREELVCSGEVVGASACGIAIG